MSMQGVFESLGIRAHTGNGVCQNALKKLGEALELDIPWDNYKDLAEGIIEEINYPKNKNLPEGPSESEFDDLIYRLKMDFGNFLRCLSTTVQSKQTTKDNEGPEDPHLHSDAKMCRKIAEIANFYGWDGVSNPKLLSAFIQDELEALRKVREATKGW